MNGRYTPATYPFPTPAALEWHEQGLCRQVGGDAFFPPEGCGKRFERTLIAQAKRVCSACPVIAECREAGMYEMHGVWGGLSANERKKLRNGRAI